jgi:hypothetical protein
MKTSPESAFGRQLEGGHCDAGKVVMLEQNDEWSLQRRYMQLEGLQSLSENQSARLSAVIN